MTAWNLRQQGRRPVKFPSPLFKGGRGPGAAPRPPSAEGGTPFRREHFSLLLSFCDRKRKKEAPRPAPRAAPWTRDGGSFGDKRLPPFGAEKPDGPVPGGRTGYPSKTSRWDVFESTEASVRGLVLAGAGLVPGTCFLVAQTPFASPAGGSFLCRQKGTKERSKGLAAP